MAPRRAGPKGGIVAARKGSASAACSAAAAGRQKRAVVAPAPRGTGLLAQASMGEALEARRPGGEARRSQRLTPTPAEAAVVAAEAEELSSPAPAAPRRARPLSQVERGERRGRGRSSEAVGRQQQLVALALPEHEPEKAASLAPAGEGVPTGALELHEARCRERVDGDSPWRRSEAGRPVEAKIACVTGCEARGARAVSMVPRAAALGSVATCGGPRSTRGRRGAGPALSRVREQRPPSPRVIPARFATWIAHSSAMAWSETKPRR